MEYLLAQLGYVAYSRPIFKFFFALLLIWTHFYFILIF